jgi:predicted dehydrogenase
MARRNQKTQRGRKAGSKAVQKGARRAAAPVRYAVVGQGYISQVAILPAFANARRNSQLVALVSDDPEKLQVLGRKYGVEQLYTYEQFDECLQSDGVDAVFIALPNHLHHPYTVRAARAGKHVLCEKPMAVTEDECLEMIEEAERNKVQLMVAYRLHFERANLKAVQTARAGRLGDLRTFNSLFCMQVEDGNIRLQVAAGGGPLYDIGIYCINAARHLFGQEPVEVVAFAGNNGEARFAEVDEMTSAVLRFPGDKLASFTCSFGAADASHFDLVGTKGSLRMEKAYSFAEDITQSVTIGEKTTKQEFPARDQFAPELLYFSDCIRERRRPEPSGEEGWADVRIIRALLKSIETRRPVALDAFDRRRQPQPEQEIHRPPVEEPELVGAKSPHPED